VHCHRNFERPTDLAHASGERRLEVGEVVVFKRGPERPQVQQRHRRTRPLPDDQQQRLAGRGRVPGGRPAFGDGLTNDQFGKPLWDMRKVAPSDDEPA
jgi:hypothetical protein